MSDRRRKIIFSLDTGIGDGKLRGRGYSTKVGINYKPIDPLNIIILASQELSPNYMQYVDIIDEQNSISRVYANSKQLTKQVEFRLDLTFSPELTLQCYLQPFYADMKYLRFYNLMSPETMDLQPYDYLSWYEDPDFKLKNTVGTFVLRWEYNPGSTLFLVYSLNEYNYFSASDGLWSSGSSNTIVVKLNYWMKI